MGHSIQEWTKWNLWKTAFKKFEGMYPFKFFKDCLPQILLGQFLNTLSQIVFEIIVYGYMRSEMFVIFWFLSQFITS